MAVQKQELTLTSGIVLVRDTDADATSENDVKSGAAVLYLVSVNNAANVSTASYLKLYNNAAPTVGTTAPDMIIKAPGGATVTCAIPEGTAFATALSLACTTEAGTAGTTNPTNNVVVALVVG